MGLEFAVFVQTPLFRERAEDPLEEHRQIMNDVELCVRADEVGFKYIWAAEHHALLEYSHLSSSEPFLAAVGALTKRIHVGSGIWPLNPVTNSPIRRAEAAAMLDHLTNGRFEMGTGRGAGTHEIETFDLDHNETRSNYEEVIREFKKMWEVSDYTHSGEAFNYPSKPHNILPKPLGGPKTHPPMWLAAGTPPSYERAGRMGLGVLGFNFSPVEEMRSHVEAYREGIQSAEPVGHYVNDNVMLAGMMLCLPDGREAREWATKAGAEYLQSLVYYYHDTFPRPETFHYVWPEVPPRPSLREIEQLIEAGHYVAGTPEEVRQRIEAYRTIGADQVAFGLPIGLPHEVAMEVVRCFGEEVLPHFDTDPVHRSDRMRYGARAEEISADRERAALPFDSSTVARVEAA